MASTVTELMNRRMMGARGSSIDWENIARGMLDYTTAFEITSSIPVNYSINSGYIFTGREGLTSCVVSEGTTELCLSCFNLCSNLTSVELPSTLKKIGQNALRVTKIKSITIPSLVTNIGANAFQNCRSLVEVIMEPTSPPILGANALNGCTSLAAIYVPDAVVSTYQGASGWSTYASIIKPISQIP